MPKPQFTDAGTLTPGPDCGISIPSIAPGGRGKGGGGRGVGAAEVTADFFFFSYSSLLMLCQGKAALLEMHYARTNNHMSGP